jgi:NhaP-type Na+/H+ or K+/H+ antiporter
MRELLEISIMFMYLTIMPFITILFILYQIVSNNITIFGVMLTIILIIIYGVQLDLSQQFDRWIQNKLGTN